jgi:photosystem II stability/assembly factor-like uncharacterized protein
MFRFVALFTFATGMLGSIALAQPPEPAPTPRALVAPAWTAKLIKPLTLRGIGPSITPGRIGDVAVDPKNRSVWYVAVASGGVWKTNNRGTTWRPIFDQQGSYSIGCITVDPRNTDVVWVGNGENESQRSVGYGDGIYKSTDGGSTWTNVGLKKSEHIAKILIDPRDSAVVYVASQGPLWAPGGDRGLYKTTDGGKTWSPVLQVSENTGITDVWMDPRNADVLYAASYQRRRHVGVLVGGGPESKVYKSTDAGKTWKKLEKGLPEKNMGRIALAVSPQKPDVIYAHVQSAAAQADIGAFFRSHDGGENWKRMGAQTVQTGEYYGELFPDPFTFDKVYVMDANLRVTTDGGQSFQLVPGSRALHPDHHALVFDPNDKLHLIEGNDGGLYETYDGGRTWRHFDNMPTPQYYRIGVDNALPFYHVYGGAQDNGTSGTPSRTTIFAGIRTADCVRVGGADGMQVRVDPTDPNTVYTSSQDGNLVRLDRKTGQSIPIRSPRGRGGQGAVRWNWDSPLVISPHNPKRLYYGGSTLLRSDDRGDNWKTISKDLTKNLNPEMVEVMGKVWKREEAVNFNKFTTSLSSVTALSESPKKEGLIYVGTDDGLVQVTEDGGTNWRKIESFPGVPEGTTWVTCVRASAADEDTVYATFHNWQRGDFKPYVLKSTDHGKTWVTITGNLPQNGGVWSVIDDPVNKNLLFVGTEFALFVTVDGGTTWAKMSGTPPIPFRDLEIQSREGDLVCGTFGRGIFVLDDYVALRNLTLETRAGEGALLPVRKTYTYEPSTFQMVGSGEYVAPNPNFGALLTYHIPKEIKGKLAIKITGADGKLIQEIAASASPGLYRTAWNVRTEATPDGGRYREGPNGRRIAIPLVTPGIYSATLVKTIGESTTVLGSPQSFEVVPLPKAAAEAGP